MECVECQGAEFDKDDNGVYVCVICGTLSQDYMPLSHDVDDMGGISIMSGKRFRLKKSEIKKATAGKAAGLDSINESDVEIYDKEIEAFVTVYQYCLKLLGEEISELIKLDANQHRLYMNHLKNIWFAYLSRWAKNTNSKMFDALEGDVAVYYKSNPIQPTKVLLLSFLYLACRLQRLWVLPCDIVKYVRAGVLSYTFIWDRIPQSIRDTLSKGGREVLYTPPDKFHSLNNTNLSFYTYGLADSIRVELPPMNAPVIAYRLIKSLGLPSNVWNIYSEIYHIINMTVEQPTVVNPNQYYTENIVAGVLMSIKLSHGWMTWSLVRIDKEQEKVDGDSVTNDNLTVPICVHDVDDNVTRGDLKIYIDSIVKSSARPAEYTNSKVSEKLRENRRVQRRDEYCVFNDYVRQTIDGAVGKCKHNNHITTAKRNSLVIKSNPTNEALPRLSYLTYLRGCINVDDVDYVDDDDIEGVNTTGLHHPEYLLLLERVAKHVLSTPTLLHTLLEQLDVKLIDLLKHKKLLSKRKRSFKRKRSHADIILPLFKLMGDGNTFNEGMPSQGLQHGIDGNNDSDDVDDSSDSDSDSDSDCDSDSDSDSDGDSGDVSTAEGVAKSHDGDNEVADKRDTNIVNSNNNQQQYPAIDIDTSDSEA